MPQLSDDQIKQWLQNIRLGETSYQNVVDALEKYIFDLREELKWTEKLLDERDKLVACVPECPVHGRNCISHAMEWIERVKTLGNIIFQKEK